MSVNHSSKDLEDLGEQFHNWQQNNPHRHIPKHFWGCALDLLTKFSVEDVAKSIGYSPSYILLKQRRRSAVVSSDTEFVELQPNQSSFDPCQIIRMNIQDHTGVMVELSFHGSVEQIFPLISSLFQEGKSCSK